MKFRAALLLIAFIVPAIADEGTWLFDHFPTATVKTKYNFDVTPAFLENLRLASVRVGDGMGAFVSPTGLIITNQHLITACLAQPATGKDYVTNGFQAANQQDELRCPGLQARVLTGMEDVTDQITGGAGKKGQTVQQRDATIAQVQQSCAAKSGGTCEVVNLYSGLRYSLYHYKPYNDLRLVFAPERQLAFFGREHDTINYLRYGLDIAFLRAYENGQPAGTPHYLKWSVADIKEGDLVFASGSPKTTVRETTAAQLTFYRDTALPVELNRLNGVMKVLNEFAAKSDSNLQAIQPTLTAVVEQYKTAAGKLIGLKDDRLVTRKSGFDLKIRQTVQGDPKLGNDAAKVWDQISTAYKAWAPYEKPYEILESDPAIGSNLYRIAREIVRGEAVDKDVVINDQAETIVLAQYFQDLGTLNEKEVSPKSILAGRTPQAAAEAMVKGTALKNPANRAGVGAKSDDPMIKFVLAIEPAAQRFKKKHEEVLGTVETTAATQIAQYRYKLFGDAQYPDANGSPRVEYGVLKSYTDRAGVLMPYAATFSGLYYRENNTGPYQVPQRWVDVKSSLDDVTPLDFVSTCDIGSGDPGAPTVNTSGELIGVIFDGNLETLPSTYLYSDEQARAVHVSTQGITEALQKVYHDDALLRELGVNNSLSARIVSAN